MPMNVNINHHTIKNMSRMKGITSSVNLARLTAESYKTTIPVQVAGPMGLAHKDHIGWTLDKIDGEWLATIRKLKPKTKDSTS